MNDLNHSRPLDVHKWSEYPEVNKCVNDIFMTLVKLPEFSGNEKLRKKHLKVIVLDLWAIYLTDPKMYIAYHRSKNKYSKKGDERYNKLFIRFKIVAVIDALEKSGFIENHKGFFDRSTGQSKMARMRAKPKLIKTIQVKHCLTKETIRKVPNKECIILRDKKKNDIDYKETPFTKQKRKQLYEYNNLLRSTFIDIPDIPEKGIQGDKKLIKIDYFDKFVRRIWNNGSWSDGGRYYKGWWQNIPKEYRKEIRIDGCDTIELDYSAIHIVILYAVVRVDYWKTIETDPYEIQGYEKSERMRSLLKTLLLIVINTKDKKSALRSICHQITVKNKENFGWFKEEFKNKDGVLTHKVLEPFIDQYAIQHKAISKLFYSKVGTKLQNIDSDIAEKIIGEMTMLDIPVLCIHDSFIVPRKDQGDLIRVMNSSMKEILEMDIDVKYKGEDEEWDKYSYFHLPKGKNIKGMIAQAKWRKKNQKKLSPIKDEEYLKRYRSFQKLTGADDWTKNYYKDEEVEYGV